MPTYAFLQVPVNVDDDSDDFDDNDDDDVDDSDVGDDDNDDVDDSDVGDDDNDDVDDDDDDMLHQPLVLITVKRMEMVRATFPEAL